MNKKINVTTMSLDEFLEYIDKRNKEVEALERARHHYSGLKFTTSELMDLSIALAQYILAGVYTDELGDDYYSGLKELKGRIDSDIAVTLKEYGIEL